MMGIFGRIATARRREPAPAPVPPRRRDVLAGVPARKPPPVPFRWEFRGPQDWPLQGGEISMSDVPGGPFDLDARHWHPVSPQ